MTDVIRRNWRFWVALAEILVLTAFFAHYIGHRQQISDRRAETQRQAICAILANIPGHIPPEIAQARRVFARPGHPHDCQPFARPRRPPPKVTPTPTPTPQATVTVVRPTATPIPAPSPSVARTAPARPTPRPTPSHRPSPHPSPSPSPTCVHVVITVCT